RTANTAMIISARLPNVALMRAPELGPRWPERCPVLSPMYAARGMTATADSRNTGTAPWPSTLHAIAAGAHVSRISFQERANIAAVYTFGSARRRQCGQTNHDARPDDWRGGNGVGAR